jgi:hypothetical protein
MINDITDRDGFLRAIVDNMPALVFVVDHEVRIVYANRAASRLLGEKPELIMRPLAGDFLRCAHAQESRGGCGHTDFCTDCVVRKAVESARTGLTTTRQKCKMQLEQGGHIREVYLLTTAAPLAFGGTDLVLLTLEDITEWIELRGLLPICSGCKKIRQNKEYWEQVETYLSRHSDLVFTHSICPECLRKYYPDFSQSADLPKDSV